MGCGTSFVKYVLFFINLLFTLVGMAMVGIGVAVLLNWGVITNLIKSSYNLVPWVFIVIGTLVFTIAFFGCCGAVRESHIMVVTYAIFLLILIIIQVILAVLLFLYESDINKMGTASLATLFKDAETDKLSKEAFNSIEWQLSCCGDKGPTDYTIYSLPESCCPQGYGQIGKLINSCTIADAGFSRGCSVVASEFLQKWSKTIAGVAIGVACTEVIGALFALCLANTIRNMDRRYA